MLTTALLALSLHVNPGLLEGLLLFKAFQLRFDSAVLLDPVFFLESGLPFSLSILLCFFAALLFLIPFFFLSLKL